MLGTLQFSKMEKDITLPKGFKLTHDYIAHDMVNFLLKDSPGGELSVANGYFDKVHALLLIDERFEVEAHPKKNSFSIKLKQ